MHRRVRAFSRNFTPEYERRIEKVSSIYEHVQ
jgi:hypothetical protein